MSTIRLRLEGTAVEEGLPHWTAWSTADPPGSCDRPRMSGKDGRSTESQSGRAAASFLTEFWKCQAGPRRRLANLVGTPS
jgi:hypothetical protein